MKALQTKHITDLMVVQAYAAVADRPGKWPYELIAEQTGASEKVAYAACERAYDRGLIECGVSLRSGWLTDKGKALVQ